MLQAKERADVKNQLSNGASRASRRMDEERLSEGGGVNSEGERGRRVVHIDTIKDQEICLGVS